jgi:hypothetical protein
MSSRARVVPEHEDLELIHDPGGPIDRVGDSPIQVALEILPRCGAPLLDLHGEHVLRFGHRPTSRYRKQLTTWSFTRPQA